MTTTTSTIDEDTAVLDALAADAAQEGGLDSQVAGNGSSTAAGVDAEIEEMKRRVQEMEDEAAQ